jgi:hypothetical protein
MWVKKMNGGKRFNKRCSFYASAFLGNFVFYLQEGAGAIPSK